MTRLVVAIRDTGIANDYLAAASRIREVVVVDDFADADAAVGDGSCETGEKPTLLIAANGSAAGVSRNEKETCFPAFPLRFDAHVSAIRESVVAGKLGRPGLLRMHLWGTRSRPIYDGHKLAAIDVALWLVGEELEGARFVRNDDSELHHLGFQGGAMAMLDFTNSLEGEEGYRSLSLIGSGGAAYADDHRDRNLIFRKGITEAATPGSQTTCIQPMLADFVQSLGERRGSEKAWGDYRRAENILRRSGS